MPDLRDANVRHSKSYVLATGDTRELHAHEQKALALAIFNV